MSETTEVQEVQETQAAESTAASAEVTAEVTATEEQTPEEKKFSQKELDEILQKRLAKLERKLERQRIESETRAQVAIEQAETKAVASDAAKPKETDFETYSEYLEALTDWKTDQKLKAIREEEATRSQRQAQMTEEQRRKQLENEVLEAGSKKYDDFEEVAEQTGAMLKSKGLNFSRAMVNALIEAENAPDIVYHLGTNLEEAERIARLPAFAQAKEIGKLEDKLLQKPTKQVSKAPEPIKPITTGKAGGDGLSDDLPIDEWMRRRNKQLAAR